MRERERVRDAFIFLSLSLMMIVAMTHEMIIINDKIFNFFFIIKFLNKTIKI